MFSLDTGIIKKKKKNNSFIDVKGTHESVFLNPAPEFSSIQLRIASHFNLSTA